MCGRFVSSSPPEELARYFGAAPPDESSGAAAPAGVPTTGAAPAGAPAAAPAPSSSTSAAAGAGRGPDFEPNYNVAPSTGVFAVYQDRDLRRVDTLHWGLVPSWAKDISAGYKMINARAETVAQSGAFRRPFARRRCIIPADGFYEWSKVAGHRKKQPYFVHRIDDEPLAFAGLWEIWRGPKGPGKGKGSGAEDGGIPEEPDADEVWVRSCSIITTEANATMAPIHNRMPVILPPSAWDAWLDPENHDIGSLERLLVPAPENLLALHPVSLDVNNVRNGGDQLVREVETVDPDGKGDATRAGERTKADAGKRKAPRVADTGGQTSLLDLDS